MKDDDPRGPGTGSGGATEPSRKGGVQSVERALGVLEVVARAPGEISLSEICAMTGLNQSTCHHLLKTLVARNYVVAASRRGTYSLGSQVLTLAGSVNWKSNLPRRAQPFIDALNRATGEAVHLAVLEGVDLVTLIKREALHALRVDAGSVGKSAACHATATGKAILAWLPDEEVTRIVKTQGMRAYTPKTITTRRALKRELQTVRKQGYAEDLEEFQPHVVCIGAPLFDESGAVIGSISVSTPTMRADEVHMARVRGEVLATAARLSSATPA